MPRKRTRKVVDRSATTDIVSQLESAAKQPHATLLGALIGGVVPWFARTLAHSQLPSAWDAGNFGLMAILLAVVLGCAVFSALTVFKFGCAAFGDKRKALGFTLALEGVMLVSTGATSTAALIVLITINALANGSVIALAREATCKQRAAIAKAAATRARKRIVVEEASEDTAEEVSTHEPMFKKPRWEDDVVDAEIVSETKLLS